MSSLLRRLKIVLKTSNADSAGLRLLEPDDRVTVTSGNTIEYQPRDAPVKAGIIFYQGGRCDPRAYGAVLRPLAAAGYHVFVPCMPLRMAVLGAGKAADVIAANPQITEWIIGGHSMGGAIAAAFASRHQNQLAALFLLGSYVSRMHAMPDSRLPILLVNGSADDQVSREEIAAQPERLPPQTRFVSVDGADHYQFGSFANEWVTTTISRDEQQRQTVAELLAFLGSVCGADS